MKRNLIKVIALTLVGASLVGCGAKEENKINFTPEEYKIRLEEAETGINNPNVDLIQTVYGSGESEGNNVYYFKGTNDFAEETIIVYDEKDEYVAMGIDLLEFMNLEDSVYDFARLFVGTVDPSLKSIADKTKVLNELKFSDKVVEDYVGKESDLIGSAYTDNYEFTFEWNNDSKNFILRAEAR